MGATFDCTYIHALQRMVFAMTEKKHALFSASGSDRWLNCPGSVMLSKDLKDVPNKWALEGTKAHELLELWLKHHIKFGKRKAFKIPAGYPRDMVLAVKKFVVFLLDHWDDETEELVVEKRVSLEHIHEDMFGTTDVSIVAHYDRLKVWDYKHGQGHVVQVSEQGHHGVVMINTQLAFYALAAAHEYDYDFQDVEIGVAQPRAPHKLGVIRSEVFSMAELKTYEYIFRKGVERCLKPNPKLNVGPWCHWCRAFDVCPKQTEKRAVKMGEMFDDSLDYTFDEDFNDMGF